MRIAIDLDRCEAHHRRCAFTAPETFVLGDDGKPLSNPTAPAGTESYVTDVASLYPRQAVTVED